MIIDNTFQFKNSTIKHNGRLDYIADFSPSSELQFSYVTDQSTDHNYVLGNVATHNYRIGYGFDFSTPTGWSIIVSAMKKRAPMEVVIVMIYILQQDMFQIPKLNMH